MHGQRGGDIAVVGTGPAQASVFPRNIRELMAGIDRMNDIEARLDAILGVKTITATEKLFLKELKRNLEVLWGQLPNNPDSAAYREYVESMYERVNRALRIPTREEVVVVREGAVDRGIRKVKEWLASWTGGNSDK